MAKENKDSNLKSAIRAHGTFLPVFSGLIILGLGVLVVRNMSVPNSKQVQRQECASASNKNHQELVQSKRTSKKNRQALIQQVIFDFEYCSFEPNGTKMVKASDVKITRALVAIKKYEVSVCGTGRFWYDCGGFSCSRVYRRDAKGNKIDSWGDPVTRR